MDDLKQRVIRRIEELGEELFGLACRIHDNPELAFKEYKAVGWLTEFLIGQGFEVECGTGGLETAFRAIRRGRAEGPKIGLLAEYDALPGVGHGCGHNLMGPISVGAAAALVPVLKELAGEIQVIGCPAEEAGGGKVILAREGVFNGLDAAMIVHPGTRNQVDDTALACQSMLVEFFGRASHASGAPEKGINALDAAILSFNNLNALRQHLRPDARLHGIITHGGDAANIVPEYVTVSYTVRAKDDAYLEEMLPKVDRCFEAGALAAGATCKITRSECRYAAMRSNQALVEAFSANYRLLGLEVTPLDPTEGTGSTDMGNVSAVVPAIHASVAIAPEGTLGHSTDFAAAAVSPQASQGLLNAAKAMSMTAVDLLTDRALLDKVQGEFSRYGSKP